MGRIATGGGLLHSASTMEDMKIYFYLCLYLLEAASVMMVLFVIVFGFLAGRA